MDRREEDADLVAVHPLLLQHLRVGWILLRHHRIPCRASMTVNDAGEGITAGSDLGDDILYLWRVLL
jgi:hypothetical protein